MADTPTPATAVINNTSIIVPDASLSFRVESMDELQYWRSIFYGETGMGKTYLCGTAADVPELRDILMIDLERGRMTLGNRKDIDFISDIDKFNQIAAIVKFLKVHCSLRDTDKDDALLKLQHRVMGNQIREPNRLRRYRTLIFDSLTSAHRLTMYKVLGTEIGTSELDSAPAFVEQRDWGAGLNYFMKMISELHALPLNILYTAGDQQNEHKVTKRVSTSLMLPGQAAKLAAKEVDLIARLTIAYDNNNNRTYRAYIHPLPNAVAKCRIVGLNDTYVDNWTMTNFYQKFKEQYD